MTEPVCGGCDLDSESLQQDHYKDEHDQEHNPVHVRQLPSGGEDQP